MGVQIMSDKRTIHGIDPYAEGGLSDLFAFHRASFGDAVMELDPADPNADPADPADPPADPSAGPADELERWKRDARRWEARAKENLAKVKELEPAKAKLTELEEANQSELEKAVARAEAAEAKAAESETRAAAKEREALLKVVAAEKKVPAKWLKGDTREELEQAADEWLEDAKGVAPTARVGHVPSAGTGDGSSASSLDEVRERAKAFAGK